ncbi:uncharacterized protein MELLADRAFT_59971 [Melampsora larici-populina 98AG31]|uniref:Uncharacterized protein n=1 Tax=Melampsora larici-populina (strain 98AG31 / pathotype 3-4-7) TaxID=747676 RepID=F4R9H2_MELLP|nr:uncharacterized protein MELLADRAFT_59971 [Melampsora larici-populina 98AG31]EGG11152.1 hypothetical protein MELLADRAFT_59971 [Melampsora larici-populina 98AG31]
MVNPLDLTKYTEDDEDDEEAFLESEQKKNKKRSDWAKGKSRAQPSENWDNDFLFGSVSTESLPLPSKNASRPNPPTRKPGSAQSTSASTHLHSSSLQHSLNQPLPQLPKHAPSNSRPLLRTGNSHKTEDDSALNLIPQDSNCSTPRKKDPHSPRSHLSVPPSLSSFASSNSSFDPTASPSLRSSIKNTPKPQPHHPPASLPTASRGLSLTHTALDLQNSSLDSGSKASPKTMGRKGTVSDRTSRPSRPPLSLRTRQASHKAVSSQDSVPSVSEISSVDIRSPSSSLSTTDDGHGNWSRSSGDYSAGFGGSGKGNRSFNTETEFTEPETELDWGDDTDFENRSSCSPANLRQPADRALHRSQPATQTAKLNGNNPSRTTRSGSTAHSNHLDEPLRAISDSSSYRSNLVSSPLESSSLSASQKSNERNQVRRSAHSSFDSQTTFTTTHSSKSRNLNNPTCLNSAASSSSSIGYYKSNHSDISLKSSASRVSRDSVEVLTNNLSQNHEAHLRRQQARTPSLSSASSNFPLPYGNHSSDSYEAATSGTETDGLSDYAQAHRRKSPMASTSSSNRVTPNATQRSRKQALYSRPPNANPSTSVSSLAGSMSSTTLNMNSLLSPDRFADDGDADADISFAPSTEDDSRLKNLRKKLRRKRPSALALSPTPINNSSTVLDRKPSVSESIYSDNQLSGDLAFAADSDEEGRGQLRRTSHTVAIGSTSPYQVIDTAEVLSINLRSPTPVAPGPGFNHRARSSVSHSGPGPSPLLTGPSSKPTTAPEPGTVAKKFKSRRPLSFTALLSRNSIASISSAQSSNNIAGDRHMDSIPHSASPGRGLFARKSSETVRDQVSKKETSRTQSHSSGRDSQSILSERPTRGHFRQAASIGSNPVNYKASKQSNTSLEPSESFISRVRRLSSRQSHHKTPPATPNRKRFSIMSGATRTTPSQHLQSPPTTASQAHSAASTPSSKRNHRSPTVSGITASNSKGSELTVRADSDAGRKARPSSKDSSSSRPSGLLRGSSLRRKFSTSTNNKASVDEPNLTVSPPAAPQSITDHNLSGSASSLSSSTGPRLRSMGSSKPPKSNPALRKRVAASVSATLENYKLANPSTPSQSMDDFQLVSPKSPDFDFSPDPSLRSQSSRFMKSGDSTYAPYSEPIPDQSILPTSTISPIIPSTMGGINAALGRSNSMGELRIPSRITSQQGRLHTELNQMKEFARGIDDLKLMRRNYRRLIESTTRARLTSATSESSMAASDENEHPSTESPKMSSEDTESVQPSPRALARISSNIARIELNYREWWTCCNVLIDLGEGEKDPKERFPHDRIPTSSSERLGSPKEGEQDSEEHEHFEILKNMFGPGGPIENESVKTPPKQQNVLRGERSFERTPVVKSQRILKNVSSSGPILMMSPETPIARTLPDSDGFVIEDEEDDNDGSVKGKEHLTNRKLWVDSPSEASSEGHQESLRIEKNLRGKHHILRRSGGGGGGGGNSSIRVCSEGCGSVNSSGGGSRTSKSLIKSSPIPMVNQQQSRKISLIMRNGSGKINGAGSARNALQGVKDFLRTLKAKIQEDKMIRKNTISSTSSISAISSNSSIFIEIEPNTHEILDSTSKEVSPTPSISSSSSSSSSSSEEECWDDQLLDPTPSTSNMGIGTSTGKKRLALSSERMPQLLSYLAIVRDQCEACLDELKSQTV